MDDIYNETAKLQGLKHSRNIELGQKNKTEKSTAATAADAAAATEQRRLNEANAEKRAFELECKKDADEKKSLLQAVINEAHESGFPMPPSLIKLLNHTNGMLYLFYFLYFFLYLFLLLVSITSLKTQVKVVVGNTYSIKQDSKENKGHVARIEEHMRQYNEGMKNLSNFVKVTHYLYYNITEYYFFKTIFFYDR